MKSRRNFIKRSAVIGAGISLAPNLVFPFNPKPATDRLKIAFIGVGLRGTNHLNNAIHHKDTEITAICDIDPKRIDIALELLKKDGRKKPMVFGKDENDYLNLLDAPDVDAVIIATP